MFAYHRDSSSFEARAQWAKEAPRNTRIIYEVCMFVHHTHTYKSALRLMKISKRRKTSKQPGSHSLTGRWLASAEKASMCCLSQFTAARDFWRTSTPSGGNFPFRNSLSRRASSLACMMNFSTFVESVFLGARVRTVNTRSLSPPKEKYSLVLLLGETRKLFRNILYIDVYILDTYIS